jgi:hypothetical protein
MFLMRCRAKKCKAAHVKIGLTHAPCDLKYLSYITSRVSKRGKRGKRGKGRQDMSGTQAMTLVAHEWHSKH